MVYKGLHFRLKIIHFSRVVRDISLKNFKTAANNSDEYTVAEESAESYKEILSYLNIC